MRQRAAGVVPGPEAAGWTTHPEVDQRWDVDLLQDGLEALDGSGAASVVVVDDGHLVAERHLGPSGAEQRVDVASVQKTIVALLVGVAVERGLFDVDEPLSLYLDRGWAGFGATHEAAITARHLLSMTSGLMPGGVATQPPGTGWAYDTMAYQQLKPLLVAAAGLDLEELTERWLAGPLGMAHTSWVPRGPAELPDTMPAALRSQGMVQEADGRWMHRMPDGSPVTGLWTTARDLARLGILLAGGGAWGTRQVIAPSWIGRVVRRSQPFNPAYGWLVWRNDEPGTSALGQPFECFQPHAPADLIAARGAGSNLVDVARSSGIVLARTALSAGSLGAPGPLGAPTTPPSDALWSLIAQARRSQP